LFAAACAASGIYDMVSFFDRHEDGFNYAYNELGAPGSYGLGIMPWTRPDIYIEDTPIFSIGQATTPTLIVCGDADQRGLAFEQALEFYMGLQRAGKKVWLLQYEGAYHGMTGAAANDLTVRMKQFFDYYLKGMPPPAWMTHSIPKGEGSFDDGTEYDHSGAKP